MVMAAVVTAAPAMVVIAVPAKGEASSVIGPVVPVVRRIVAVIAWAVIVGIAVSVISAEEMVVVMPACLGRSRQCKSGQGHQR